MKKVAFLFGEAEKGEFCSPSYCKSLEQLAAVFGEPPKESKGLYFAIQALLLGREVFFYRVQEEGFSSCDYHMGLSLLEKEARAPQIGALFMPGMADAKVIDRASTMCLQNKSLLVITAEDLFDFLCS